MRRQATTAKENRRQQNCDRTPKEEAGDTRKPKGMGQQETERKPKRQKERNAYLL